MPTHITTVKKGDKNELEKEKVGEQERGKIEYKEMEPPIIEKRGNKRPMSEPRHENQTQKRLRTVISETIHCVDIAEVLSSLLAAMLTATETLSFTETRLVPFPSGLVTTVVLL
jgi:hypothetical protein